MRKIGTISLVAVSALALAAGITQASTPAATNTIRLVPETELNDDRGGQGRGSDDAVVTTRELEPGDDKGAQATAEPTQTTEPRATAEPGDDKGGQGEAEPGDDKGGDDDGGGHGSDD
jgi:hypothetical protein